MHTIEFNFTTITNHTAIDSIVFALALDLLVHNRITCTQPTADRLEFESELDCMFAQLKLCDSSSYTLKVF